MERKTCVVILGGGAAGMLLALELASERQTCNLEVTLVDCKTFYEYTPALCSVLYEETDEQFRTRFGTITMDYACTLSAVGVQFVLGRVLDIDTNDHKVRLAQPEQSDLAFDHVILCTGASNHAPWCVPDSVSDPTSRLAYLQQERDKYTHAERIVCLGGGPVGVELVAEMACRSRKQITLVSPSILNGSLPRLARAASRVIDRFDTVRVVHSKARLRHDGVCETDDGETLPYDLVYQCTGIKPNTDFLRTSHADWLDATGHVKVDACLRVSERVFAIGDVNTVKEPKMFFTAHMQAMHCFYNLKRIIRGTDPVPYQGSRLSMIVSLGPRHAVGSVSGAVLDGWPFGRNKGSKLASFAKYVIERISMNDLHLKAPANQFLYSTHERGHLVPRLLKRLSGPGQPDSDNQQPMDPLQRTASSI